MTLQIVTTTNDIITWTAGFDEMDAISKLEGRTVIIVCLLPCLKLIQILCICTVYCDYSKTAGVTFGDKIKAYWYPTTESTVAKRDTVRMNVPRPTTNDKAVQDILMEFSDNF